MPACNGLSAVPGCGWGFSGGTGRRLDGPHRRLDLADELGVIRRQDASNPTRAICGACNPPCLVHGRAFDVLVFVPFATVEQARQDLVKSPRDRVDVSSRGRTQHAVGSSGVRSKRTAGPALFRTYCTVYPQKQQIWETPPLGVCDIPLSCKVSTTEEIEDPERALPRSGRLGLGVHDVRERRSPSSQGAMTCRSDGRFSPNA